MILKVISVLRGGAATALYGQAGSNGVVLITTKSAKAGKMRVDFTTTYGIDEVNKFPDVQSKLFPREIWRIYDYCQLLAKLGTNSCRSKSIDPTHPDKYLIIMHRDIKRVTSSEAVSIFPAVRKKRC